MATGVIYKLTFPNCDWYYLGSAKDVCDRFYQHLSNLKKENHHNIKMQRVFNKYGQPKISIVERVNEDNLLSREQHYINLNFGKEFCLNLSPDATRPVIPKRDISKLVHKSGKAYGPCNEHISKVAEDLGVQVSNLSRLLSGHFYSVGGWRIEGGREMKYSSNTLDNKQLSHSLQHVESGRVVTFTDRVDFFKMEEITGKKQRNQMYNLLNPKIPVYVSGGWKNLNKKSTVEVQ